jgi:hypothetical protein
MKAKRPDGLNGKRTAFNERIQSFGYIMQACSVKSLKNRRKLLALISPGMNRNPPAWNHLDFVQQER